MDQIIFPVAESNREDAIPGKAQEAPLFEFGYRLS
jgi:hypothetical protein